MRKWLFSWLAILLLINPNNVAWSQNMTEKLHDLYFSSVAYPENFDGSIELLEASGSIRDPILYCLRAVHDFHFQLAAANMQQCENAHGGNSNALWQCLKDDENGKIVYWAKGLIDVIQSNKNWVDTFSGGNFWQAKRILERMQPGLWVRSVRVAMPIVQNMLQCP